MRDEHVSHVFPHRDGPDGKTIGQCGGKILQAVNGTIDLIAKQRMFDLACEKTLVSDLRKRGIEDPVSRCLDDLDMYLKSGNPFR